MTMLRFLPHQRVGFREYMRSDGTFSYFFSLDTVRELFHAAGLVEVTSQLLGMFSVSDCTL
jgi:methyltransferase-like protein 6